MFDRPGAVGPRVPLGGYGAARPGLAEVVFHQPEHVDAAEGRPTEALRKGATHLPLAAAAPFAQSAGLNSHEAVCRDPHISGASALHGHGSAISSQLDEVLFGKDIDLSGGDGARQAALVARARSGERTAGVTSFVRRQGQSAASPCRSVLPGPPGTYIG